VSELKSVRNILVIKLRNIGDVLLTGPVFANLRLSYPEARICALVNSGTEEMLSGNPVIDKIYLYDRNVKKYPLWKKMAVETGFLLELRREKFDLVINLTEGDRGALLSLLSGARYRVGIDAAGKGLAAKNHFFTHLVRIPDRNSHTVEQNLWFLAPIGVPVTEKKVTFAYDPADLETVTRHLDKAGLKRGRFFHAHLTSRWMFKTMPATTAARLVDELAGQTGLPVVFTASPEEKELVYLRKVLDVSAAPRLDLSGVLTLKQLGALSSQARFFVGVDSAPMHIAAALDVPVFSVFGPTSATGWGPWDNRFLKNPYSQVRGVQTTGRHLVLQSDRECVPCKRDGCNGSKISDCLNFTEPVISSAIRDFLQLIDHSE
jgi:heptosyltransferase-3